MSENNIENAVPSYTEEIESDEAIPSNNEAQIFVPVKFNKQVLNLELEKAQELAQKGMKFDVIAKDYEAIKTMAFEEGKSVGEFVAQLCEQKKALRNAEILEKCGGDAQFAQHILELEKGKNEDIKGFDELKENFSQIKSVDDLPESVVDAAKLKGTLILDEYLRYLHREKLAVDNSLKKQKEAEKSATGSLLSKNGGNTPETEEFLRGLWQK